MLLGPRILVVDDEANIRLLFRHVLEGQGHQVEEAADGAQALEACRARRPDVVVTDINMPVKNGFELLEDLSRDCPGIGRVVVTAEDSGPQERGFADLLARAGGAEVLQILHKPIRMAQLLEAVIASLAAPVAAASV